LKARVGFRQAVEASPAAAEFLLSIDFEEGDRHRMLALAEAIRGWDFDG